jgi:hypothetical protein
MLQYLREIRLIGDMSVMLVQKRRGKRLRPGVDDPVPLALDPGDDFTHKAPLHTVGLEHDKSVFFRHCDDSFTAGFTPLSDICL